MERLSIKLERDHKVVADYSHDDISDKLRPYVEQAMADLKNSGDPTQSRTYEVPEGRIHVRYRAKWGKIIHEVSKNAWTGQDSHTWVERYRKWP